MPLRFIPLALAVVILGISPSAVALEDKDFGITRQTHGSSTFTFRNEKLLHELTKLGENWIEIFYNGSRTVFVRSGYLKDGAPVTTSERFPGGSDLTVQQLSKPGDIHPSRICVGPDIYNRKADGFFEIMPNPLQTLTESTVMGAEFSTRELDELRKTLLNNSSGKKE